MNCRVNIVTALDSQTGKIRTLMCGKYYAKARINRLNWKTTRRVVPLRCGLGHGTIGLPFQFIDLRHREVLSMRQCSDLSSLRV